jgi:hypothetical protein
LLLQVLMRRLCCSLHVYAAHWPPLLLVAALLQPQAPPSHFILPVCAHGPVYMCDACKYCGANNWFVTNVATNQPGQAAVSTFVFAVQKEGNKPAGVSILGRDGVQ